MLVDPEKLSLVQRDAAIYDGDLGLLRLKVVGLVRLKEVGEVGGVATTLGGVPVIDADGIDFAEGDRLGVGLGLGLVRAGEALHRIPTEWTGVLAILLGEPSGNTGEMILVAAGERHLASLELNGLKADGAILGGVGECLVAIGEGEALHPFLTERALGVFTLIDEALRDTGYMILVAAGENHTATFQRNRVATEGAIVGHFRGR